MSVGEWQPVGNKRFSEDLAYYQSIALDKNGTPYVAYAESMDLNDRKAVVMRFNGNGWEYVGRRGFSEGAIGFISIALDPGGTPYVAFEDFDFGNKASV